ncbi:peptidase U35, partial [Pseudomonas sp. 2588-5]
VVNQCSFVFTMDYSQDDADEWRYNEDADIYERRVNKIQSIRDISIVTTPAYSDTEAVVGARSKEKVDALLAQRKKPDIEKEKMLLELDLLN